MEHPSKQIISEESAELSGKCIVVGVTSGVAMYRVPDIIRGLMRKGANVYVVMSKEASKFISPEIFKWASGNEVFVEFKGEVGHITLSKKCDALLIVPATANTLSKIAYGIADTSVTLVTLNFLGLKKKVIVVPTMHESMYKAPQLSSTISKLASYNILIIEPEIKDERAKLPSNIEIIERTTAFILRGLDMKDIKALVTAGPTREYLDPVRFLTNASSGKMGVSIAKELYYRGAEVILIHGPLCNTSPPRGIKSINVETTEEMGSLVKKMLDNGNVNVAILAGAPVDFKFEITKENKIASDKTFTVKLKPTPKIISTVRKILRNGVVIGFAAEIVHSTEELISKARDKMLKYDLDMIVANNVSRKDIGFCSDFNEVVLIKRDGTTKYLSKAKKDLIARAIVDELRGLIKK